MVDFTLGYFQIEISFLVSEVTHKSVGTLAGCEGQPFLEE